MNKWSKEHKIEDTFIPSFCFKNDSIASAHIQDCPHITDHHISWRTCSNIKGCPSFSLVEDKISLHEQVKRSGKYNFESCRIRVNEKINTEYLRSLLQLFDYNDSLVCDLIEFGFPLGFTGNEDTMLPVKEIWKYKNYKGATDYPVEIGNYLVKEMNCGAIIGPFKNNPFTHNLLISPLNSVPKKVVTDRRVILDLSSSTVNAVNNFIDKDNYLGECVDLLFPKVDDFVNLILAKGQGCLLFKKDLCRAYRQINICPSQYNLVAYVWQKHIFCDTVLSMGLRSAAAICQRVTNAVAFIMYNLGIAILNYLDDFAGVEKPDLATTAYCILGSVLEKCGIEESVNKSCPPSTIMSFLGVLFNTLQMSMEITPDRMKEIRFLLKTWLNKDQATLREVQALLGKLNFIGACVKSSRVFISRLLNWLRELYMLEKQDRHDIPIQVRRDILWWNTFLPKYNGISLMSLGNWSSPDAIFSSDACLEACGGFWNGHFFHSRFPEHILRQRLHIGALEMLSLVLCLHLWGQHLQHMKIVVLCDNQSVCVTLNTGKARCPWLQSCLREISYYAAINEFEIRAQHLSSEENRIADHLSRWHAGEKHELNFRSLTKGFNLTEWIVNEADFVLSNDW